MNVQKFLECVEKNRQRVNAYKLGHDGSDGLCDCIGLAIGALRLGGERWTGTHGSNYATRNEMRTMERIRSAGDLKKGELVYKAYEKGETGWALPPAYAKDPDQRDYYHVGVVTGTDPLVITHCTGVQGGIKVDKALGKWKYHGYLKKVVDDVEPEQIPEGKARVTASAVAIRKGPGTDCGVLIRAPKGALVDVAEDPEDWVRVTYQGKTGYMMKQYTEIGGQGRG